MFERTRTYNLLIRSQTLYPIELQTPIGIEGFEPSIPCTKNRCLTTWPYPILCNLSGGRLELPTRRFSVSYSNQLSYPD